MKFNKWTVGLAAIGVVSLASAARADEKMSTVQTALSNTTLSGYVDTAAVWRPGTDFNPNTVSGAPNIPGQSYSQNDGFYLNAVDLAIDHPEDESPWAAGYHAEFMLGPGSTPTGLGGLRQAYVTLRTPVGNGLDWKIGVWDTIVGYESNSDPLNPNYTRSYGYSIEPTTHTGILATYKISDAVTVQGGIADGSNVSDGPAGANGVSAIESQKAYMGDVQFTAPDSAGFMKGATMTAAVIVAAGNSTTEPVSGGATSFYVGATIPTPVTALKVGGCFDYLDLHNGDNPGNSSNDNVWNIALYTSYQATDKLSFNLRGEYLNTEGLTAADAGSIFGANTSATTAGLYGQNKIEELTATAQYNLWANVISRVEFRWDHAEHRNPFGSSSSTGLNFRDNDFLLALNVIYQF
ncbi:MAG TPA: outer membrane beta-barrel protein [Candidatus Acidoferrales bacterium]|nr:outer membrane beta-barrel protein [Candidatus Acidoferrales bacterium]